MRNLEKEILKVIQDRDFWEKMCKDLLIRNEELLNVNKDLIGLLSDTIKNER